MNVATDSWGFEHNCRPHTPCRCQSLHKKGLGTMCPNLPCYQCSVLVQSVHGCAYVSGWEKQQRQSPHLQHSRTCGNLCVAWPGVHKVIIRASMRSNGTTVTGLR